ncbi:MAG: tyrosine-type recombinase/integrase, partial [Bacteroidota bacterium]
IKTDLYEYLNDGRKTLLKGNVSPALFISKYGKVMKKESLYQRFKQLQKDIIEEPKGLHTLRHSIATHLLWQGMPLYFIARFLGHASIESTQIYTHIKANTTNETIPNRTSKTPISGNDH